jgi:Tfp pilus assembly protein PilW
VGRVVAGVRAFGYRNMMSKLGMDEQGAFLVDLLVGLALGLVVLGLVLNMLVVMETSHRQQSVEAELLYSGRVVQEVIQNQVRTAVDIEVINGGKTLRITDTEGKTTAYYSEHGNFYRSYKTSNPVAENVKSVRFVESEECLLVEVELQREEDSWQISFVCAIRC